MKLIPWVAGLMLALFAAMHVFIAFEHLRQVGPQQESVIAPVLVALVAASLAIWIIRRASRRTPAA